MLSHVCLKRIERALPIVLREFDPFVHSLKRTMMTIDDIDPRQSLQKQRNGEKKQVGVRYFSWEGDSPNRFISKVTDIYFFYFLNIFF